MKSFPEELGDLKRGNQTHAVLKITLNYQCKVLTAPPGRTKSIFSIHLHDLEKELFNKEI